MIAVSQRMATAASDVHLRGHLLEAEIEPAGVIRWHATGIHQRLLLLRMAITSWRVTGGVHMLNVMRSPEGCGGAGIDNRKRVGVRVVLKFPSEFYLLLNLRELCLQLKLLLLLLFLDSLKVRKVLLGICLRRHFCVEFRV